LNFAPLPHERSRATRLIRRWLKMADGGFVGHWRVLHERLRAPGRIHGLPELQRPERGSPPPSRHRRSVEDLFGVGRSCATTRARHTGSSTASGQRPQVVFAGIVITAWTERLLSRG
jgi:hypothetical protein